MNEKYPVMELPVLYQKRIIKSLFECLKSSKFYILGSFARSAYLDNYWNGIDLFFYTNEDYQKAINHFTVNNFDIEKDKKYCIKVWYESYCLHLCHHPDTLIPPEQMCYDVDFTVNGVAIISPDKIICHPQFIIDSNNKKLHWVKKECSVIGYFRRIIKYAKKGFIMDEDEIRKLSIKIENNIILNYENRKNNVIEQELYCDFNAETMLRRNFNKYILNNEYK